MPDVHRTREPDTSPQGEARRPANDETPADRGPTPSAALDEELAQAREQAADYEDRWKRSVAEFVNYRRRTEQERGEAGRSANAQLILDLLPILDDLERALASVPADEAESEWVKGIRLVERKFRALLERQGVTPIEAVGQPFDPSLHEAVAGRGSVVTDEYQRGYRLNGRVLRPSLVVVGERDQQTNGEAQTPEPARAATEHSSPPI